MMKSGFSLALALAASALAVAQPALLGRGAARPGPGSIPEGPYASAEISAVETELGSRPLGELAVDRLVLYRSRIEAARLKDSYLRSTAWMSMRLPGAGQFRNGDTLEGAGFLTLHAGTVAGTLVGFYYLLPSNLRFDKLDYLDDPIEDVAGAWASHGLGDYLPAMGAVALGAMIDMGIRYWSARSAYAGAREAVDAGKARVEPVVLPGFAGMRMRF